MASTAAFPIASRACFGGQSQRRFFQKTLSARGLVQQCVAEFQEESDKMIQMLQILLLIGGLRLAHRPTIWQGGGGGSPRNSTVPGCRNHACAAENVHEDRRLLLQLTRMARGGELTQQTAPQSAAQGANTGCVACKPAGSRGPRRRPTARPSTAWISACRGINPRSR